MGVGVRQGLLIAAGGLLLGMVAVWLVRRQLISLRYAIGWLAIAVAAVVGAVLSPAVKPLSARLGMTPTGLLLALASGVLLVITVQLSISVSGLRAQIRELAEAHALLEARAGGAPSIADGE
jgi:hypothetical protein